MAPSGITVERVESPSDARVDEAVDLFYSLMKGDIALKSLTGGEPEKIADMGRAMLRAGIHSGEYYEAKDASGGLIGFLMTMPPGQDLFSTEEQRALGLTEFMAKLSPEGKEYYKTTYLAEFPAFVNKCLGPTGKLDSWYIHIVMVQREHQGKGVGKSLIDQVVEKATTQGDVIAMSTTTALNATIYQKCGLTLLDQKIMPSPWGEWPLYILSLDTRAK
ncbi:hypothetical protein BDY19DRAFT_943404 [Irpex rosettiformis]|uniref:Uncharacterized protein n=1 Tax=Irpex rosettiformis TaxID=378272 RepID=A0ACB8U5H7_9APHY|nr:hypothetical protein BDY19DRAFT_943404 [Irpex rosettiformis]